MNIEKLLAERCGTIVDVRSPDEFKTGKAHGAVNVPLNEIPARIEELKNMNPPLILCCASGGRSSQAHLYLGLQGIETVNAGSWLDLLHFQSIIGN